MLEQFKHNFILIICALVGVIIHVIINQNARYEHKSNGNCNFHKQLGYGLDG